MTTKEESTHRAFDALNYYKGSCLHEGGRLVDIETAGNLVADMFHAFGEVAMEEMLTHAKRNFLIETKDDNL